MCADPGEFVGRENVVMKKLLLIFSMLMSFVLCHAQFYDPSIPSQQVPYAKQELSGIIKDIKAALPIQTDEISYWEDAYISKKVVM